MFLLVPLVMQENTYCFSVIQFEKKWLTVRVSCASFDVRKWSVAGHCESEDLNGVVGELGQLFKNGRVRVDTGHFGKSH